MHAGVPKRCFVCLGGPSICKMILFLEIVKRMKRSMLFVVEVVGQKRTRGKCNVKGRNEDEYKEKGQRDLL